MLLWYISYETFTLEGDMITKMKKLLIPLMAIALSVTACSSCTHKTPPPSSPDATPSTTASATPSAPPSASVTPPTPPASNKFSLSSLEFTLPSDGWKQAPLDASADTLVLLNPEKKNLIVVVTEKYDGKYQDYVILALRGIRGAGATIVSAKQVEINGHKFVLVESNKSNVKVWMWVTLLNGQGYGLSCGGPSVDDSQKDLCAGVANTINLH